MSHTSRRRTQLRTAAALGLTGLGLTCLGIGAGPVAAGAASRGADAPAGAVTAVVTLAGSGPVTAPGLRVVARLGSVQAEVVRGNAAALAALARDPRVRGVAPDSRLRLAGNGYMRGESVVPWKGLGDAAGTLTAGAGTTVALVDTGVSDTSSLNRASGRLVDGVDTSELSEGGDARTTGTFTDGYGHGTFLATVIAGGVAPGTGTARGIGVAPGARVVVVKVADAAGETSLAEVLAGLDWVASHRPISVMNLSLGAPRPEPRYGADPLTAAVAHVRDSGVTVVVSAGNNPDEVTDPGYAPEALTVGAADTTNTLSAVADWSGRASVAGVDKPDVVANGVHILGQLPPDSLIARTNPQAQTPNGLWRGSGTSEAAAVTTGVVAAYLGTYPDASPVEVKQAVRAAALPLPTAGSGAGLVNLPARAAGPDAHSGEESLDQVAWAGNAWRHGDWSDWLGHSWSASTWGASTWGSNPWGASTWGASTWGASTWGASTWGASTWGASTWGASTWGASTWGSRSWGE